ncbi:helix-turn-helix domain-containing protein [Lysinibacillus sp. NPDC097287]|uniref:helix-turn-helix domain-containing protein n=1 Tax=Lysinibacillus sp. NPDC097287 TaxID=3364144 RepID=UPI00381AFE0B
MKNSLLALSIFSLAVSIVVSSWLISNSLTNEPKELVVYPELLTQEQAADYLGLTISELIKLGPISAGAWTTSNIPYIKIGNKYYYSKEAINNWLKEEQAITVP